MHYGQLQCVMVARSCGVPKKHLEKLIVRFQTQLEADGCFLLEKSSELAFHCKQNELSCSLFLPKFLLRFLAHCRKWHVFKTFC